MFTEGDIAIAIEWWDRTTDDEGLTFEKWVDTDGDTLVQDIINSRQSCAPHRQRRLAMGCTSPITIDHGAAGDYFACVQALRASLWPPRSSGGCCTAATAARQRHF